MLAYYDHKGVLTLAPKDYNILFSNPDKSIERMWLTYLLSMV